MRAAAEILEALWPAASLERLEAIMAPGNSDT